MKFFKRFLIVAVFSVLSLWQYLSIINDVHININIRIESYVYLSNEFDFKIVDDIEITAVEKIGRDYYAICLQLNSIENAETIFNLSESELKYLQNHSFGYEITDYKGIEFHSKYIKSAGSERYYYQENEKHYFKTERTSLSNSERFFQILDE